MLWYTKYVLIFEILDLEVALCLKIFNLIIVIVSKTNAITWKLLFSSFKWNNTFYYLIFQKLLHIVIGLLYDAFGNK